MARLYLLNKKYTILWYVLFLLIATCLCYFWWYSETTSRRTIRVAVQKTMEQSRSSNVPVTKLWYDIDSETQMWHIAHYEHRYFAYGAPAAIILSFFHYYLSPFPGILYLKLSDSWAGSDCIKGHIIPYGKVLRAKGEVNFFYTVVFRIKNDTEVIPNSVHLYQNDSTCTSPPIVYDIEVYYKYNETQVEIATCLYKGILPTKDVYPFDIVSWIEINRALGVDHITMYDQELTPQIFSMLRPYREEGFVELIGYNLPHQEKTAYTGQLGTIQDCFYRYLRRAKYIVFIDLDELIIPRQHASLSEMMAFLSANNSRVTQFRFYNSFWHLTGKQALGQYTLSSPNEIVPVHFQRTNRTLDCPPTKRHKNIIKVEGAVRIGIHHVYQWKWGERFYQVPENVGLMHHYRRPDYARNEEQIEDMIMSKFAPQVMTKLKDLCNYLSKQNHR